MDDPTLTKLLGFEADRLHSSLEAKKKTVASVLGEAQPGHQTRDGGTITIDRSALLRLAENLDVEAKYRTKIPVDVTVDSNLENEAYITSEPVARALRSMEGFGEAYRFRDGKMHLPMPIALEIIAKHAGVFQVVLLIS